MGEGEVSLRLELAGEREMEMDADWECECECWAPEDHSRDERELPLPTPPPMMGDVDGGVTDTNSLRGLGGCVISTASVPKFDAYTGTGFLALRVRFAGIVVVGGVRYTLV